MQQDQVHQLVGLQGLGGMQNDVGRRLGGGLADTEQAVHLPGHNRPPAQVLALGGIEDEVVGPLDLGIPLGRRHGGLGANDGDAIALAHDVAGDAVHHRADGDRFSHRDEAID